MGQSVDSVLHLFRRLLGSPAAGTGDHELLDAFVRRRDERAFEELIRRHGPMVLGVCRRVLRDPHSADDAFQVTFLTLACKASSLRQGQALPAWLHRVAFHVALRVRARGRCIEAVEKEAIPMSQPEPSVEAAWRELSAVLDEELQRLPEVLRGPVVLCGLEGKTHEEAARELGWPLGSLSKRLARGRELLRQRLARRGIVLGSPVATACLIGEATAAVPEALLSATLRGAVVAAAGRTAELSAATATLLREVLGAMFWTRVKFGVVVLLLVLIVPAIGMGLFALVHAGSRPAPQAAPPERQDEPPARAEAARQDEPIPAFGRKTFRFRSFMLAIAYSPDGKLLAVSDCNTIHLYDAATKKELRSWDGQPGFGSRSLAFSPDSKVLATAGQSPQLHLWDAATGKLLREFAGHSSGAHFIAFSPDGKFLLTAGEDRDQDPGKGLGDIWRIADHSVRLWDASTGKEAAAFKGGLSGGTVAAFSPNGQFLAWGDYHRKVHVRKVTGGDDVFTYREGETPERQAIAAVAFSPNSKVLAVGNGKIIKLFDLAANAELQTLVHKPRDGQLLLDGSRVCFSPDGKTLGSIGQAGIALWDVASGKLSRVLGGGGLMPHDLAFHRDGKRLANTASDQSVRFWDLDTGKEEIEPGHRGAVSAVLSPDGKLVVTGSHGEALRFWDRTGKELPGMPTLPSGKVAFVPDGLLIIGGREDALFQIVDLATGKEKVRGGKGLQLESPLTLSADGKLLAMGQQKITVYEVPSAKEKVILEGMGSYCSGLAFGPEGKTLVSVGQETLMPKQTYAVKLWDLTTGKELRRLPHPEEIGVLRVVCSPDARYVLTNVRTYDFGPPPIKDLATCKVVDGQVIGEQSFNWPGNVKVFSPNGKLLAVANELTQAKTRVWIDVYDTTTWEKVALFEGHTHRIVSLAFSADGRFLVSGSLDASARVWEIPERKK